MKLGYLLEFYFQRKLSYFLYSHFSLPVLLSKIGSWSSRLFFVMQWIGEILSLFRRVENFGLVLVLGFFLEGK